MAAEQNESGKPDEMDELIKSLIGGPKKETQEGIYKIPVRANASGKILDDETKPTVIGTFIPGKYLNPMHKNGHDGIDLQAPKGTPIYALAPGEVIKKTQETDTTNKIGGNTISIKHSTEPNLTSYYAHMTENIPVNVGSKVDQNTIIGYVGNSGNARYTSAHLHFETKINNANVDPFSVIGKKFGFTDTKKSIEEPKKTAVEIHQICLNYASFCEKLEK